MDVRKDQENEAMKRIGRKFGIGLAALLLAAFALAAPRALEAQDKVASIHGHVQNPLGQPIKGATLRLTKGQTTDPKEVKWAYTFQIDDTGNFKADGIDTSATYLAVVWADEKSVDFVNNINLKPGEDRQLDFDMTRQEYIDKMTPEARKQLEEFKKKNADIMAGNAKIANLNAALQQSRADIKAGNFDPAVASMTQATTQAPAEAILWVTLGDAQLGQADAAAKAAKAAGTSMSDPALVEKYTTAEASYQKAIDANTASKKPNPETAAAAYNQLGQAYARTAKIKEASDAFANAAKAEPARAGMYYFNEAATLFNAGKPDDAGAAADKAIAADPTKADAYYIKGQSLIPKASVDPKTQKITAPPGCVDAYQKYLELAPDGPHAQEVKDILTGIGEKVKSSYKAGKKNS